MIPNSINLSNRGPFNPFTPQNPGAIVQIMDVVQEGLVVDVIVNDKHPEYAKDGYNVGAIKFRLIKSNLYRADDTLNWALPIDSNISEYPLLNEIVIVFESLKRWYYTKKINTSSRVTAHGMFGLNEEMAPVPSSKDVAISFKKSVFHPVIVSKKPTKLGNYFVDLDSIRRLRHDEGDVIFEGRSGQSIRLGAAWKTGTNFQSQTNDQSPNLLFRVGPDTSQLPSSKFGLVTEDINKDKSSIWMVSDQIVNLKYSTQENPVHKKSIESFPDKLVGSQIVINTDRFVVNTKSDKIMGFSAKGIHWTTNSDFTVDAGKNYKKFIQGDNLYKINGLFESVSKKRTSLIAPKVFIGVSDDTSQPIPAGELLAQFLQRFIDAHIINAGSYVLTAVGPGSLSPAVITALQQLKVDVAKGALASFNSTVGYVKK